MSVFFFLQFPETADSYFQLHAPLGIIVMVLVVANVSIYRNFVCAVAFYGMQKCYLIQNFVISRN